ncbi:MAG: helix-turn-helix domain-containing protein [Streptosporangiaceae bacterium]|nr:helix-turn-helix domain-containing protein [Streptosporangiaceae bacterium]
MSRETGAIGAEVRTFGVLLRSRRLMAGLTQERLAHLAGISVAAIRDLEQGRRLRPRARSLTRLADALGLDTGQTEELVLAARGAGAAPATGPGPGQQQSDLSARLRLEILGPLAAWRDGTRVELGPPRQRAVLALLALEPDTLVHRETIIDTLWGDRPPPTAVNLVQTYVSRLRRAVDGAHSPRNRDGTLVSAGTSYRLRVAGDQLDLLEFRRLAGQARTARSSGDALTACRMYEQALRLWRQEPLADVDILRPHPALAVLAGQQAAAVMEYAEVALRAGLNDQVLAHLRALVTRDPLNEKAHSHLMIVLAGSGYQAEALQVYEDLRKRLDSQLGIQPGPALTGAYMRVLRQDVPASHAVP